MSKRSCSARKKVQINDLNPRCEFKDEPKEKSIKQKECSRGGSKLFNVPHNIEVKIGRASLKKKINKKIVIKEPTIEEPITKECETRMHPINKKIKLINQILSLTKNSACDFRELNSLIKKLYLPKCKITQDILKSKEKINEIKESMIRVLYNAINQSNNQLENPGKGKFFVGNGNNPMLVKAIFKERWWLSQSSDVKTANILWTQWKKKSFISKLRKFKEINETENQEGKHCDVYLCNHLEGNGALGNKKGLFKNMRTYYGLCNQNIFNMMPLTFHIGTGKKDPEYNRFKKIFDENNENNKNIWIVKPGENSNRGIGILVSQDLKAIDKFISNNHHTYIIQKYIERPLLFQKRKFDIRCFGLITSVNGLIKGYFYQEGYLRTSTKNFTLNSLTKAVHLTNEAIQIKYDDFGKYEAGNKVIQEMI